MSWDPVTHRALPSRMVTHLHLLRHGRVDTGGERRAYGHTDYPLDEVGRGQTAAMLDWVNDHLPPPLGVLSSDLARCTSLAVPLAEKLGVELTTHSELREQHMGEWEGVPWSTLTSSDLAGVRAYWSDYLDTRPPGGESFRAAARRVYDFLDAREASMAGGRWILVTHVGVIRAISCRFLGVPLDEALRFTPMPGSHTWFLQAEAGGVLQVLGERPGGVRAPVVAPRVARAPSSDRKPRLALSGSAGTGKSTLGRALAGEFDVPYIPEGMRERIEQGLDLHALDGGGLRDLIRSLMDQQLRAEDAAIASHGGFVSDRSPLDHAAFWLVYGVSADADATETFFADVRRRIERYDRVVLLPWGVLPLRADGVRSSNPWVQRHFQATVEGLLSRELDPSRLVVLPSLGELEQRVGWVLNELGS